MVIQDRIMDFGGMLLIGAQQSTGAVFERLDPPRRAAVVMALLGLTLIGLFLITFAMIGGHWVRRLARHRPGRRRILTSAGPNRELGDVMQINLPESKPSDTVSLNPRSKDTSVEG